MSMTRPAWPKTHFNFCSSAVVGKPRTNTFVDVASNVWKFSSLIGLECSWLIKISSSRRAASLSTWSCLTLRSVSSPDNRVTWSWAEDFMCSAMLLRGSFVWHPLFENSHSTTVSGQSWLMCAAIEDRGKLPPHFWGHLIGQFTHSLRCASKPARSPIQLQSSYVQVTSFCFSVRSSSLSGRVVNDSLHRGHGFLSLSTLRMQSEQNLYPQQLTSRGSLTIWRQIEHSNWISFGGLTNSHTYPPICVSGVDFSCPENIACHHVTVNQSSWMLTYGLYHIDLICHTVVTIFGDRRCIISMIALAHAHFILSRGQKFWCG